MQNFQKLIEFVPHTCGSCGVVFAFTADDYRERTRHNKSFRCVNGCSRQFCGETEADKLKRQLASAQRETDHQRARANRAQEKAERTGRSYRKMRERIKNGLCPCCDRHFQNLWQHMKNQHPEFGEGKALRSLREMLGLTQADVAEEAGMSAASVSNFEQGRKVSEWVHSELEAWMADA